MTNFSSGNLIDAVGNAQVTQATALDDTNDSITSYPKCSYSNISASALVKTGTGEAYGFFVGSYTATATLKLWDNTSAATTVLVNTCIVDRVGFYPLHGVTFATGLYATIATAALDVTILYR